MKKIKIPIHSITDLITNSSTVIFTYSSGSESALEEMINELFKTFNINKTCADVFDMVILCDGYNDYDEYLGKLDELPKGTKDIDIKELYNDVQSGKIPKPKWFNEAEAEETRCDYFTPDTYLYLNPKEKKYEKLAELVHKFLYSTNHEATRDG